MSIFAECRNGVYPEDVCKDYLEIYAYDNIIIPYMYGVNPVESVYLCGSCAKDATLFQPDHKYLRHMTLVRCTQQSLLEAMNTLEFGPRGWPMVLAAGTRYFVSQTNQKRPSHS